MEFINLVEFKDVILALNQGKMATRMGWDDHGGGMFVFKQVPSRIEIGKVPTMQSLPESVKKEFVRRNNSGLCHDHIFYVDQLCIVYGDNCIRSYSPAVS